MSTHKKNAVVGIGYVSLSNAVLLAQHNEVIALDFFKKIKKNNGVIFDTKACLERALVDARL